MKRYRQTIGKHSFCKKKTVFGKLQGICTTNQNKFYNNKTKCFCCDRNTLSYTIPSKPMNTIEKSTSNILTHHLTAFGDNNLDEIMLDYTEQSTVLTDKGAVKGIENIRKFFEVMFSLIPTGSQFEMKQLTISDKAAHIIWASKSAAADIPFGTDTFIIEDDKILVHTVAAFIR